ncbi:hypoxanthine phosphoribosyltransferase [Myxococcota bacterium]|nr:hypoxanthine phosphoribosyltransferase [Myxococcota bacterium]
MRDERVTVLIDEARIAERVAVLATAITRDYAGLDLTVIGILKGSFLFMADLVRRIDLHLTCDFLELSSYGDGMASSGVVRINKDLSQPIAGRHCLVVEDIVDTGLTLRYLLENLSTRGPASVRVCTLLDKPEGRRTEVDVSYVGFRIPNAFVVGYGLDLAQRFRNIPYVGVYHPGGVPEGHGVPDVSEPHLGAGRPQT